MHARHGSDPLRKRDVPFRVYARIVPFDGKPQEYYKDMEVRANRIEEDLQNLTTTDGDMIINIATPIAFTPQFGDKTARVTVIGFYRPNATPKQERTDATFDYDQQIMSGQVGGPNPARTDPTAETDQGAAELKSILEAASSDLNGNIYKMEYGSVAYGEDGRTFP